MNENRRIITIEPDRLYWAVLPKPPGRLVVSGGERRRALAFAFEEVLPLPIESIQFAFTTLDDGRVLACGIESDQLGLLVTPSAVSIFPSSLPTDIESEARLSNLNLLTGPFTPPPISRARRIRFAASVIGVLVISVALGLGLHRRTEHDARIARSANERTSALIVAARPDSAASVAAPIWLTTELRRLRATRAPNASTLGTHDVSADLVSVLAVWPREFEGHTESLRLTDREMTVRAVLPASNHGESLLQALTTLTDWEAAQPRLGSAPDGVRITVSLSRERP